MLSSYSALNHGHLHPKLVRAMKEQLGRVALTSRAFHNEPLGYFCRELAELCGTELVLPMNTGAEAVETALKCVRKWGYTVKGVPRHKAEVICCRNNFHGRTITVVSFSTEPLYRDDFGPFTPGFKNIPFGDSKALARAINKNTVAFLVEPIQGEAGINVPPKGYLRECLEICRRENVLFVADEIQTGLGRTGRMFACDHEDVKPDIYILGKALGGGLYPVSAITGSKASMGLFKPGEHGSTFGGNPLAAAVGRAALKALVDERLVERSAATGEYFMKKLRAVDSPHVKAVRGRGLLIGVELYGEAGGARRFCERLMKEGLLCKETHENVIRFAPPLIISRKDVDWALERISKVLRMK
jgi:ornithine--oxo-acid transaminase